MRLLPAFDTYLMGHRDRDFIAPPDLWRRILPGGGILRPAILVDGRAVGIWSSKRAGRKLKVVLEPFDKLDATTAAAVDAEVADVARFEGQTLVPTQGSDPYLSQPSAASVSRSPCSRGRGA